MLGHSVPKTTDDATVFNYFSFALLFMIELLAHISHLFGVCSWTAITQKSH